jgi:hypothetical protein
MTAEAVDEQVFTGSQRQVLKLSQRLELVGQYHLAGGEVPGGVHASAGEVANAECYLVHEGSVTT